MKIKKTIHDVINGLLPTMEPNGTLLVALNEEIIYKQCFGFADMANKTLVTFDTQFLAGSVTKQFTAAAILKALLDISLQNGIDKNDLANLKNNIQAKLAHAVAHYLPQEHPLWDGLMPSWAKRVTLHQLLIHSSGISNYTGLPDFENKAFPKPSDLVDFFKTHDLEFNSGEKFSYSNSGYFLLGIIAQQITHQPLESYLQTQFFAPFNMHASFLATQHTAKELKQTDSRAANLACGYQFDMTKPQANLIEVKNSISMQIPGAAGSLVSTASDLLKWNNALYTGKIIPLFLLDLMLKPHIQTEQKNAYYGYGIEVLKSGSFGEYYTHRGGIPGFHSKLTFIPSLQLSMIVLENLHEDKSRLMPEIERMRAALPTTLTESEKWQEVDKMIAGKYPSIIENRQRYELMLVEEAIIEALSVFENRI
ncbi:MAG: beta-lactamase family protein [Legionellales bacterium]|nr:beta-lactamase family protein [Legionellales bacterium]